MYIPSVHQKADYSGINLKKEVRKAAKVQKSPLVHTYIRINPERLATQGNGLQGYRWDYSWDFAIKRGHFALLNVLSYFNPLLTIFLLNILGLTSSGSTLWLGAILISLAAVLCSHQEISKPIR